MRKRSNRNNNLRNRRGNGLEHVPLGPTSSSGAVEPASNNRHTPTQRKLSESEQVLTNKNYRLAKELVS